MFLRNAWYVAAWADEVTDTAPLGRTYLGDDVVLFRRADGTAVALEDRCCHRGLPLSLGKIVGGDLECGYHGLVYDGDGRCVRVPGQQKIPPGSQRRVYPVVERWRALWIWMGEPSLADQSVIPALYWMDHPDWRARSGRLDIACTQQLIVDNVLDLTHLSYVHAGSFGTLAISEAPARYERIGGRIGERIGERVRVTRWILDSPPPPVMRRQGGMDGQIDRRQLIHFLPPGVVTIEGFFGAADATLDTRAEPGEGIRICNLNALTPVDDERTLHFFAQAQSFAIDSPETTEQLFQEVYNTFLEDIEVLETQHRVLARRPDTPLIDINADAGALEGRRIMERLLAAEAAQSGARARPA